MKRLVKIFIAIICLLAFVYFGQAQKAKKVNEVRIKYKYKEGEISKEQYESLIKQNTLLKTLLNPKEVLITD